MRDLPLPSYLEPGDDRRAARLWHGAALLVFVLASLVFHRSMWGADWSSVVPVAHAPDSVAETGRNWGTTLKKTDQQFVVWLISRNARTLLRDPLALYEAEPCFPAKRSLALGEPGVNLGLLGIPARLITGDPIATFNSVWLLLPLLSAFAMYWVVMRWTGLPAAGIAAGLFYAFHPLKVHDPVHFYAYDTMWALLAFFFAQRLFESARWRDALALTAAVCMQLAGSLYPVLSALLAGIPFAIWLLRRYGVAGQRPAQWIVMATIVCAAMAVLYGPFLAHAREGELAVRTVQVLAPSLSSTTSTTLCEYSATMHRPPAPIGCTCGPSQAAETLKEPR
jgi:hypothetical protein